MTFYKTFAIILRTVFKVMDKNNNTVTGTVIEALPNTFFRVELDNGDVVLAYLAGKMRLNRIRVLVGDKVALLPEPYGGKARITKRF